MSAESENHALIILGPDLRAAYLRLVEERFGLRLSVHQTPHLERAIIALLADTEYPGAEELYAALFRGRNDLLEVLAARLTVGETHFFRVAPQIEALRTLILPEIVRKNGLQRRLRLWSAGCSTGEEPYTLAILLRELLPVPDAWDIQLLATDINVSALDVARHGYYGEWAFRGTPPEARQRYFVPEGRGWRLGEHIRRMVRFASLNLAGDAFPALEPGSAGFDLILCRNVTIYFSTVATKRLYRRFAEVLAPGGWLVLGPSDPTPSGVEDGGGAQDSSLYEPVSLPNTLLWRRAPIDRPRASTSAVTRSTPALSALTTVTRSPGSPPRGAAAISGRSARAMGPPAREHAPVQSGDAATAVASTWTLVHAGARVSAREQAIRLVHSWPLEAQGHLVLGMLDLDEGLITSAAESLRRATFLDKDNALAHFCLGRAYQQQAHLGRAQAAFTHARRLLAAVPAEHVVLNSGGIAAGELRGAIDAQITANRTGDAGTLARRGE